MILRLKCTNFRKHTSADFEFHEGLNCLKGGNESGKSTAILAIAYALFGVRVLPVPLSEVVTWGNPEATLRVELTLTIDGVRYTITRGKSGCECVYDGGTVTGQTEVTNFMSRLLKADLATASKLMLSTQMDIRGALEAGPKATSELIERLSEFGQIDALIDLMQEKLELGNTVMATSNLEKAQADLDSLNQKVKPDFDALERSIKSAEATVELARKVAGEAQAAYELDVDRHSQVKTADRERRRLDVRTQELQRQLAQAEEGLTRLKLNPVKEPVNADAEIQCMMEKKVESKQRVEAHLAYKEVAHLLGRSAHEGLGVYAGSLQALEAEIKSTQQELDDRRKGQGDLMVAVATETAKLNSGNCSFCGQDFSDLPQVKEKNDAINAELSRLTARQVEVAESVDWLKTRLKHLNSVLAGARPILNAANLATITVDPTTVPPVLAWKGEIPEEPVAGADYDGLIAKVKADVKAHVVYLRQIVEFEGAAKTATRDLEATKKLSSEIGSIESVAESEQKLSGATSAFRKASETLDEAKSYLKTCTHRLADEKLLWEGVTLQLDKANETVKTCREAIERLEFNNALLKRVRACRPALADQLWNLVLSSVSRYFSELRGEPSRVSKSSDGFFIDGHPVQSFSGSALDVLGLAIRVALVRTFLPTASFLILDEPAAACSDERTSNMLGFLSTVGFRQIILVTHEEVSESVADHVIVLGD